MPVANVDVFPTSGNAIRALFNFIVYRCCLEREQAWLIGQRKDVLRTIESELQMARRAILLHQNVRFLKNLTVYL
ncbi:aromatic-ring-hydroxylating dioxygenase subunit beta [Immundisolibacter sp.]|uniref:aromatic-ring-hydroxylating dioxygenase subunit beta n=1 Tax=Immundisolibacter sp. TaxID=1934948 RepID=UPI003563A78A